MIVVLSALLRKVLVAFIKAHPIANSLLAATLMGVLLALTFPPSPLGWLAAVPLAWLFVRIKHSSVRRTFQETWWFACGLFGTLLLWLHASLMGLLGVGIIALYPFLVGLLAGLWAVTLTLTRALAGRFVLLALPFALTLLDTLRETGALGFTWGNLGYTLALTPLVQVAELGGVSLLGLLVGLSASALASRRRALMGLTSAAWLAALSFGLTRPAMPEPNRTALLIQGNVDPREKVVGQTAQDWSRYLALTGRGLAEREADIVVWPETAVSWGAGITDQAGLQAIHVPVLLGAALSDPRPRNSVLLTQEGRLLGKQDKVKLVPFGEFFPGSRLLGPLYQAIFRMMGLPQLTGREPGQGMAPVVSGDLRFGTLICYESTFPVLARVLVREGANVLVTPSNDAWFGSSMGAEQHFQMGRVRAIETRRWWLRVGNDGVTAAVNPQGVVTQRLPRFMAASLAVKFAPVNVETWGVRLGDAGPWLTAVVLLLIAVVAARERRQGPPSHDKRPEGC